MPKCGARGYYARIWFDPDSRGGQAGFQKEYEHSDNQVVFSKSDRVPFPGGVSPQQWYGMKFVLRNTNNGQVHLQLFVDFNENGRWELLHSIIDNGNNMKPMRSTSCHSDGTPFVSPGPVSFFRTDDYARVEWKDMQILDLDQRNDNTNPPDLTLLDPKSTESSPSSSRKKSTTSSPARPIASKKTSPSRRVRRGRNRRRRSSRSRKPRN